MNERCAIVSLLLFLLAPLTFGQDVQEEHPKVRAPLPGPEEIAKLPADGGPEFNRLVFSQSPYLLQHARNPVDWYEWGEEAFAAAVKEDKPVFLSVGYSTCHWCHVMEHESFEDAEVAALMNANFICVKVDREERPDIDQVYMTVTQALTGRGGWPMTVVMTPDKKPFFAGTYYPKDGGTSGRPGMLQIVPGLADAWKTNRDQVTSSVTRIMDALAERSKNVPGAALDESTMNTAYTSLAARYDTRFGGFGQPPKFPIPHQLRFLLRYHKRTGNVAALEMVEHTLQEMRKGGIWDHIGYGFHRYSTDRVWLLPHFEKMLYDQALMAMAYIETWQVTQKDEYRRTAEEILTYVQRDMTSPEGGFYSAEDADSEGEEGVFYVWKPTELKAILGKDDGQFVIDTFGVVAGGNFVDQGSRQKTGDSILHLTETLEAIAARTDIDAALTARLMESVRSRLFAVREQRIHPLKDDKVLTDWNGLMIAAFAKAGQAFNSAEHRATARKAADFALAKLRDDKGRLFKRYRQGNAAHNGVLEDYAFLSWGLLELYEATGDVRYLEAALDLTEQTITHFWDKQDGGFYMAPDDGEALIVRSKDIYDGALPSGNSVMVQNLLRLGRMTAHKPYDELAHETMTAFAGNVSRGPSSFAQLLCAVDFAVGPTQEVVIAGTHGDASDMFAALHREFLPNKVVVFRPQQAAGEEAPMITRLAAYTKAQTALDGKPTAYVCENYTCQAPTTDIAVMLEYLAGPSADDEESEAEVD